jgi:hypothetical protein
MRTTVKIILWWALWCAPTMSSTQTIFTIIFQWVLFGCSLAESQFDNKSDLWFPFSRYKLHFNSPFLILIIIIFKTIIDQSLQLIIKYCNKYCNYFFMNRNLKSMLEMNANLISRSVWEILIWKLLKVSNKMFWDNDKNWEKEREEIAIQTLQKENGLLFTTFYGTYEHNILFSCV